MQISIRKNTKDKMGGLYYWTLCCIAILTVSLYIVYTDYQHPYICAKSAKVKSILSVDYRSATILLDNGETAAVTQATLKPGSDYCLSYERS